jgi:hypothetical protein
MIGEKTKVKSQSQRERFEEAARSLECDESEERFDAALRTIAAHKPPKEKRESQKSKTGK